MGKNDSFIKSIFNFSISTWVNFIIGILSSFISTRLVSPEIYGLYNIFNTIVTTVLYVCLLGLDSALLRFYNEPPNNESKKLFSFKLIVLSVISTFVISIFTITFFYKEFSMYIFGYASYYLTVMAFICVLANLVLRYLNIIYRLTFNAKQYTIQNILVQSVTRFCIIFAVIIKPSFENVVFIQVIGIVALVLFYFVIQRHEIFPDGNEICYMNYKGYGNVFKFAILSAPTYVLINLNLFISQQIIRTKLNTFLLGIYSSASYFITLLNVVNGGFSTFWAAYVYGNYKYNQKKISEMHEYIMLIMTFMFIFMMIFKDVIYILIGPEYHASKVFVSLIILPPILEIIAQTTIYGINLSKNNQILLFDYLILVILNLILSIMLVNELDLIGIALAGAISSLVSFCLNTMFGQKYYRTIQYPVKTFLMIINIIFISMLNVFCLNKFLLFMVMIIDLLITIIVYLKEFKKILNYLKLSVYKYKNNN